MAPIGLYCAEALFWQHQYTFNRVPRNVFATFFPGAVELAEIFDYFEEFTYLGGNCDDRITLARQVAGKRPTHFATWARVNMPARSRQSEITTA